MAKQSVTQVHIKIKRIHSHINGLRYHLEKAKGVGSGLYWNEHNQSYKEFNRALNMAFYTMDSAARHYRKVNGLAGKNRPKIEDYEIDYGGEAREHLAWVADEMARLIKSIRSIQNNCETSPKQQENFQKQEEALAELRLFLPITEALQAALAVEVKEPAGKRPESEEPDNQPSEDKTHRAALKARVLRLSPELLDTEATIEPTAETVETEPPALTPEDCATLADAVEAWLSEVT